MFTCGIPHHPGCSLDQFKKNTYISLSKAAPRAEVWSTLGTFHALIATVSYLLPLYKTDGFHQQTLPAFKVNLSGVFQNISYVSGKELGHF